MQIDINDFSVQIDDEDFELFSRHRWFCYKDANGKTYVKTTTQNRKTLYLHRYLLNAEEGLHVDHINGDELDNRRQNLRQCTPSENAFNRRKSNKGNLSGCPGVSKYRDGRWKACISPGGQYIHLGYFHALQDAIKARKAAESRYC